MKGAHLLPRSQVIGAMNRAFFDNAARNTDKCLTQAICAAITACDHRYEGWQKEYPFDDIFEILCFLAKEKTEVVLRELKRELKKDPVISPYYSIVIDEMIKHVEKNPRKKLLIKT